MALNNRIGDASLASSILDSYLDLEGLTESECEDLEIGHDACETLVSSLGWGREGLITLSERARLEKYFTDEFVEALAGPKDHHDPALALKKRVSWLADEATTHWWHFIVFERKPEERARMIQELGDTGVHAAKGVEPILGGLEEKSHVIRLASVEALGMIGREAKNFDPRLQEVLVERGVPLLRSALRNWSATQMPAILRALGEISPGREVMADLRWAIQEDKPWPVRQAACYALGNQGDAATEAISDLRKALKGNFWVAKEAARALGKILPYVSDEALVGDVVRDLIPLLAHNEDFVQEAASGALIAIGRIAMDELLSVLGNPSLPRKARVHRHAAGIIGEIARRQITADPLVSYHLLDQGISSLIWLFEAQEGEEVDREVRTALIKIGRLVGVLIFDPLLEALGSPDLRVVVHVTAILGDLAASFPRDLEEIRRTYREKVIPRLKDLISHGDEAVRLAAVRAVGQTGSDAVVLIPNLLASLFVRGEDERKEIKKTLIAIGPGAARPIVENAVRCPIDKRGELVEVLKGLGKASVPPLIEALGADDIRSEFAVLALASIGEDAVEPLLAAAAASPEADTPDADRRVNEREAAVKALGIIVPLDQDSIHSLFLLLSDPSPVVRDKAAEAVVEVALKSNDAILRLARTVASVDLPAVLARQAAWILGEVGQRTTNETSGRRFILEANAVTPLTSSLSRDEPVHSACVDALIKIGGPAVLKRILDLFGHENPRVREGAVKIAAGYRERGITAVVDKLRSGSENDRDSAQKTLVLVGSASVSELTRVLQIWPAIYHPSIISVLAKIQPPPFDVLIWLLTSSTRPETQEAAMKAFEEIGAAGVEPVSLSISRSRNPSKKLIGIRLLERLARAGTHLKALEEKSIPVLIAALSLEGAETTDVREGARRVLLLLGRGALNPLRDAAKNPVNAVQRQGAITLIGKIGGAVALSNSDLFRQFAERISPELISYLTDADPQTASAVRTALVEIGLAAVPALVSSGDQGPLDEIGRLNDSDLVQFGERLLADPDWRVREWAMEGLKRIFSETPADLNIPGALVDRLEAIGNRDTHRSNRTLANEVLELIRDRSGGDR